MSPVHQRWLRYQPSTDSSPAPFRQSDLWSTVLEQTSAEGDPPTSESRFKEYACPLPRWPALCAVDRYLLRQTAPR